MKFECDMEIISTTYDLQISVADLRDLVNAGSCFDNNVARQEVKNMLKCIEHKNRLPEGSLTIE